MSNDIDNPGIQSPTIGMVCVSVRLGSSPETLLEVFDALYSVDTLFDEIVGLVEGRVRLGVVGQSDHVATLLHRLHLRLQRPLLLVHSVQNLTTCRLRL